MRLVGLIAGVSPLLFDLLLRLEDVLLYVSGLNVLISVLLCVSPQVLSQLPVHEEDLYLCLVY